MLNIGIFLFPDRLMLENIPKTKCQYKTKLQKKACAEWLTMTMKNTSKQYLHRLEIHYDWWMIIWPSYVRLSVLSCFPLGKIIAIFETNWLLWMNQMNEWMDG